MPSVTTITSYKPVGLVNRTGKKVTQRAKLGKIALDMPKLREMVKGQKFEVKEAMKSTNNGILNVYVGNRGYDCYYPDCSQGGFCM